MQKSSNFTFWKEVSPQAEGKMQIEEIIARKEYMVPWVPCMN